MSKNKALITLLVAIAVVFAFTGGSIIICEFVFTGGNTVACEFVFTGGDTETFEPAVPAAIYNQGCVHDIIF